MCSNEACLGYLLIFIVLFFAVLIFVITKIRKFVLASDLKISAETLWNDFQLCFPDKLYKQKDFLFSIWQDKSATQSRLIIKNHLDLVVGEVDFPIGAREYTVFILDQIYKINVNQTWSGRSLSLLSRDGKELAHLERKSFSPRTNHITVPGLGRLTSTQPIFQLKAPITYSRDELKMAATCFVSAVRRIGRMGCFSDEISLPIRIFILSMTS